MKPFFYLFVGVFVFGAWAMPEKENTMEWDDLQGPIKMVEYLDYGNANTEELARILFDEKEPSLKYRVDFDESGRILYEIRKNVPCGSWTSNIKVSYVYGDYHIESTDVILQNVLLEMKSEEITFIKEYSDTNYFYTLCSLSCFYDDKGNLVRIEKNEEGEKEVFYNYGQRGVLEQVMIPDDFAFSDVAFIIKLQNGKIEKIGSPARERYRMFCPYDMRFGERKDPLLVRWIEYDQYGNWTRYIQKYDENYYARERKITYWDK